MRPMNAWFAVLACLTLMSAAAAMTLRNLVHCALALALTFIGIGTLYLYLGAQFLGLAQLLVYVGAIAVLIVFVILLTRGRDTDSSQPTKTVILGIMVTAALFGILGWTVLHSFVAQTVGPIAPSPSVRQLGTELMSAYVLPLELIGLMLTAALIGAAIVAMKEKRDTQ
jgi:NADH:ubiquinone oxidoreductase subunit 6 (subunit J)